MADRYRFDPGKSHFTVQAFATGMLAMLGHDPTFAVLDFVGVVQIEGDGVEGLSVELTVFAGSLTLLDQVKPADLEEITRRMHHEVLETTAYPEIHFQGVKAASQRIGPGHHRVNLDGRLTLHGVTQPQRVEAEVLVYPDGLQLRGGSMLGMSSFQIRPVTALGGAIKLKNDLKVTFDLEAVPETP